MLVLSEENLRLLLLRLAAILLFTLTAKAQTASITFTPAPEAFAFANAALVVEPTAPETVRLAANCFAADLEGVTGHRPALRTTLPRADLILVGVAGQSPLLDELDHAGKLRLAPLRGSWENAITQVVDNPFPGVKRALVIAGSDRRGAAFALFTLSRRMGVSPWTWWADVPIPHHDAVFIRGQERQLTPSVQYRGLFLNDEDWGLRPWAAKKMDPAVANIGPHTYARLFELLLRLHANSLWPAMHPGTLAFNALPENAKLADAWGIVMGSSHSEALLRNNVGEWDEKRDGPWNYQLNRPAMDAYWDKRIAANGAYENFYTVGLRGVHDSGLEATGTPTIKARLVEQVMADQHAILAAHGDAQAPQVIWLYKESLALYRAGMRVPPEVTLGWTDDNFGYLRQLPTVAEQGRPGGSGLYYHVSYWGRPHDYLWLCTTPPALLREELTKAYDHGTRRYWILNVGDLKPAESDIDYFLQLAWSEPATARLDQHAYLSQWFQEQFPTLDAEAVATLMDRYYRTNFIRKPEHMGFNGYDDAIRRTAFNPLAWGSDSQPDQNRARLQEMQALSVQARRLAEQVPPAARDAFFELVGYPVQASAAQNEKFLYADRSSLPGAQPEDAARSRKAYDQVQTLTAHYNTLAHGKWEGMMDASPRKRHAFEMPDLTPGPVPASWTAGTANARASGGGFIEQNGTISINAAHFSSTSDEAASKATLPGWRVLPELGISPGGSVVYGAPGLLAQQPSAPGLTAASPWLDYPFTAAAGPEPFTLTVWLLPTFPVDAAHHQRFGVSLDGGRPTLLDATTETQSILEANDLRNATPQTLSLGPLAAGPHHLRLFYLDPGVVFEHLVLTRPGAPPAYPVPPETVGR